MKINTVYVEITNHCNLNCATCYNRSGLNKLRKEISCVQIEKIISTFIPYGLNRIIFSGGEPTLHTEFDKILDLTEKYPNLTFGVTTNGTNPHKKLLNYLNTKQNMSLQVSLDGSCEEVNSKTRGKGNFEKTIFFLKQITPLRRWGKPEDVASLACFLASDDGAYLNGVIIPCDGGITMNGNVNKVK